MTPERQKALLANVITGQGILDNLLDRRGIKQALREIDTDVMDELRQTIGEIALAAAGYAVEGATELATPREEVARLRAALDFYACADHYPMHGAEAPDVVRNDGGAKARAALARAKAEGLFRPLADWPTAAAATLAGRVEV
jgi:hypothetical protein